MSIIKSGDTILFQGDSITDMGRSRTEDSELGAGYVNITAAWLAALRPEMNVKVLNRGISGDRAKDLKARWQEDCIDLKPDLVSILIGINDTWRRYDSNDPTSAEAYEAGFRNILTRTRDELGVPIVVIEPFLLHVNEGQDKWREDLNPKIQVARDLAREFNAVYVPMDGIFAAASVHREASFWIPDGVHPSQAGGALIGHAWLKAVGVL